MAKPLNYRQLKFVEVYAGNATMAARMAGYSGEGNVIEQMGAQLIKNPRIAAAIKARDAKETLPGKASRLERQEFWSAVLRDDKREMRDRLKASELLGRSEADFTEKLEVKGELTLETLVLEAARKPGGS